MEQSQAIAHATTPLSIGGVLRKTFNVFSRKPLVFIGLTAISAIPDLVSTAMMARSLALQLTFIAAALTLSFMLQAAVAYGTYQIMLHRDADFSDCLSRGIGRFGPLLLASLLMIAAIAAIVICTFVLSGLVVRFGIRAIPGLSPMNMMFGMPVTIMIFVVIGLFVAVITLGTRWLVVIPCCIVEQLGPVKSMRRSALLTKGCRWQVLALFLLTTVAIFSLSFGLGLMSEQTGGFAHASSFIVTLVVCIPQAFQSVMVAVIYHALRLAKEGVSVGAIVDVFE